MLETSIKYTPSSKTRVEYAEVQKSWNVFVSSMDKRHSGAGAMASDGGDGVVLQVL